MNLLSCPFCGSNSLRVETCERGVAETLTHHIGCDGCGAKGPPLQSVREEGGLSAVELWNAWL